MGAASEDEAAARGEAGSAGCPHSSLRRDEREERRRAVSSLPRTHHAGAQLSPLSVSRARSSDAPAAASVDAFREAPRAETDASGSAELTRECGGVGCAVHIFAGEVVNGDLDQSKLDKLTIDVDPDCEFIWNDEALNKVRLPASSPLQRRKRWP